MVLAVSYIHNKSFLYLELNILINNIFFITRKTVLTQNIIFILFQFTELKIYVDFLKNQCYKSFYINAWQVIINNAFCIPSTLSKEELHEVYIRNFLMIQVIIQF